MRKIAGYLTKNRSEKDQKIAQSTHENGYIKPRKTFWRNSKQLLKIKTLSCGGNQISELDFSNNKEIERIGCSSNLITNLDLSNMESLTDLTCSDNPLKVLDVSNCKNLKELFFQNNINPDHQTEILNISGISNSVNCSFNGNHYSLIKKVYLTIQEDVFKMKFHHWGERNFQKYPKPNHYEGFQYPEFIYK